MSWWELYQCDICAALDTIASVRMSAIKEECEVKCEPQVCDIELGPYMAHHDVYVSIIQPIF